MAMRMVGEHPGAAWTQGLGQQEEILLLGIVFCWKWGKSWQHYVHAGGNEGGEGVCKYSSAVTGAPSN